MSVLHDFELSNLIFSKIGEMLKKYLIKKYLDISFIRRIVNQYSDNQTYFNSCSLCLDNVCLKNVHDIHFKHIHYGCNDYNGQM